MKYYVRKSFEDEESQLKEYVSLNAAEKLAEKNAEDGYKVFDEEGNLVFDPKVHVEIESDTVTDDTNTEDNLDVSEEVIAETVVDDAKQSTISPDSELTTITEITVDKDEQEVAITKQEIKAKANMIKAKNRGMV